VFVYTGTCDLLPKGELGGDIESKLTHVHLLPLQYDVSTVASRDARKQLQLLEKGVIDLSIRRPLLALLDPAERKQVSTPSIKNKISSLPLPFKATTQQRRIPQYLLEEDCDLVLCQGPPGTFRM
jgi:hypothetical protein